MSAIRNFIPISRKIFEHQFWCEDRVYSRFEAWLDLIQSARFEDTKLYAGNKVIEVKRGQVYSSLRYLSNRWNWSTKKVVGFLELLIADHMLSKETLKETGQTLITILNYDTYNKKSEQKETLKETAGKRQGNSKETKYKKENKYNKTLNPLIPLRGWRDSFEIYLSELNETYHCLLEDPVFLSERERYHPGVHIKLSLEKAYKDYWATEAGWKYKKKSRTEVIDWKATLRNALDISKNKVWLKKGEQNNAEQKIHVIR